MLKPKSSKTITPGFNPDAFDRMLTSFRDHTDSKRAFKSIEITADGARPRAEGHWALIRAAGKINIVNK